MDEQKHECVKENAPGASTDVDSVIELKKRYDEALKENMKLREDKAKLVNNFINNNPAEGDGEDKKKPEDEKPVVKIIKTEEQLAKEFDAMIKTHPSNLDYAKKVIEMDDWHRENKGESIFLPKGRNVNVTENERATADRVHDAFKDAIEASNGDPKAFDSYMSSICPGRFPEKKIPLK